LVAYFAGEMKVEDLQATLANQLPHFMQPATYVQLEKMPLTPNGKIDRKQLPAPVDEAFGSRLFEVPIGETEEKLALIWSQLLEREKVGRDDHFFQLGGHSLLAMQLISKIRKEFEIDMPLTGLFLNPVLKELAAVIDQGLAHTLDSCVVPLRNTGNEPPVFFVHTLEGNVGYASSLSAWIDHNIPVYGVSALGLNEGETPLRTVEEMAAFYIKAMRRVQECGPYRLASWSAGGQVAYEIACQLRAAGEQVSFLGLIDTFYRATALHDKMREWYGDESATQQERERAMLLINLELVLNIPAKRINILAKLNSVDDILSAAMKELDETDDSANIALYKRHNAMQCAFVEAIHEYTPPVSDFPVCLFITKESQRKGGKFLGWNDLLGERLRVVAIKGTHESIMQEPKIKALGDVLSKELTKQ
jgi:thioesterase domain-containing protein/acyl carrier protein